MENTTLRPFRFWAQKVLPLVYDDSLSYYEVLCKVVEYLNKVIENANTNNENIENLYNSFNELKNYVDNYFNNLDVQTEIDKKLDEMAESGVLDAIVEKYLNNEFYNGFNDSQFADVEQIATLDRVLGMTFQGGTYIAGYFYIVYGGADTEPLYLRKYNENGAVISELEVNKTGHGNGVARVSDDLIAISDSYTNTLYFINFNSMQLVSSQKFSGTALSSIACSQNYNRLALQCGGQVGLTIYYKSPINYTGFDNVWYKCILLDQVAKGDSLVQDCCYIRNGYIASLVTNITESGFRRHNMIRITSNNGTVNKDIYFSNDIREPECIAYDQESDKILIVGVRGDVYRTEKTCTQLFYSSYFGTTIATVANVQPSLAFSDTCTETVTGEYNGTTFKAPFKVPIIPSVLCTGSSGGQLMRRLCPLPVFKIGTAAFGFGYYESNYIYFIVHSVATNTVFNITYHMIDNLSTMEMTTFGFYKNDNRVSLTKGSNDYQTFANNIAKALNENGINNLAPVVSFQNKFTYEQDIIYC